MKTDEPISIKVGGRTRLFTEDVAYFEADLNYTIIHFNLGKPKIVATTLGTIQNRICPKDTFVRPNRKFLINLDYINNYSQGNLLLQNELEIHISRRRIMAIKPILDCYMAKKDFE
jgi:DNA-binding LytR/AlgR family response regulator